MIFKDYKVDDVVDAAYPHDGVMYPAIVVKVNGDGTFQVKWENADARPEESTVGPKEMKFPPIPLDKLELGQKYVGRVCTITSYGAFVDIGAEVNGLLHISRIATERVEDAHDYLEEGQEIDVWISGKGRRKFGLTMIEGQVEGLRRAPVDLFPFANLPRDTWLNGRVITTMPFGAWVSVTAPQGGHAADGLLHVSELSDEGFVEKTEDKVRTGQEVQVRIKGFDFQAGRLNLSMRKGGFSSRSSRGRPADLSDFASIGSDVWLTGKVARTAPLGALVTVTAENGSTAEGFVHIAEISDRFVESVEDELSSGQEVQVRVISVDPRANRLRLSMKRA
mmetsp:Transcript_84148/g.195665  ORF Transcript_84148/g.195665 Transcript_84148/m.195665 type:complete len:336 (+) Transcript_84148:1-1008(+)